jgi:ABC-type multidrug transport system ATPase subunit
LIRVVDIFHQYSGKPVLQGVSLEVARGEIVALLGPNGMGKSTLLATIAGVLDPIDGYVEIDGLRRRSSVDTELAIRKKCVYLPAEPWVPAGLTIREWLWNVGDLWDVPKRRRIEHIGRLVKLFDLPDDGDRMVQRLSTGQRSKAAISAALVADAPVLLLDEPFGGGLDPAGMLALTRVLSFLAHERGRTIVIATPVPDVIEGLADRVAIVRDGVIGAVGRLDELHRYSEADSTAAMYGRLVRPDVEDQIRNYLAGVDA